MSDTVNIIIVGVGGQGVLKASQVLSSALVQKGCDVKQSEVHGMAQRGGSVVSEVRFGSAVRSPLAPEYDVDYVVALDDREGLRSAHRLKEGDGQLLGVPPPLAEQLADPRSRNMAALGRLSAYLDVEVEFWHDAIRRCLPPRTVEMNIAAFEAGRQYRD